ncbi:MAG: transporter substrate-binding domain-containing protein [Gammaproteobacteria bacterium]|nr:transporter substrate-binding domain-containing protein [Gammaproteobacteria bacterium]
MTGLKRRVRTRPPAAAGGRCTTAQALATGLAVAAVAALGAVLGSIGLPSERVAAHEPSTAPYWLQAQLNAGRGVAGSRAAPAWQFIETGDLPALQSRGRLRILVLDQHEVRVPQRPSLERQILGDFASRYGLQPVWVRLASRDDIARALTDGRGDVAIDEFSLQYDGRPQFAQTAPLRSARYIAVARGGDGAPRGISDLLGRRIAVGRSSPVWGVLERLADAYPTITLLPQPEFRDDRKMLAALARGEVDVVVGRRDRLVPLLASAPDLEQCFDLTDDRPIAWTTRASAPSLREALDEHLHRSELVRRDRPTYTDDLPGLQKRGVLRIVTRADPDNYFLDKGRPAGFEHDLALRFAAGRRLRVEVIVVDSAEEMSAALRDGHADLMIARSGVHDAANDPDLVLSRPYYHVAPTLVTRAGDARYIRPAALRGARLLVHPRYTDRLVLESLRAEGLGASITYASADVSPAEVLGRVASGVYDATVIDSHRLGEALAAEPALRAGISLDNHHQFRWAVRVHDRRMLAAVNGFLRREFRSADYNVLRQRYFHEQLGDAALAHETHARPGISPYDGIARRYADQYGFDWRLLVAQMFEESRFNPRAVSTAGAVGLMQVLPNTARALGFEDLRDPAEAVHAGTKYLYLLRTRFEADLPLADRTWFAVAAYHSGYDRVRRARERAVRMGLDPDRWFDNVERAMRSLGRSDAGGFERRSAWLRTVYYVRGIRDRYETYLQLPVRLAANGVGAGDHV